MTESVECHAGHDYAQRPMALHWKGQRLVIDVILAEWREPEGKGFRVLTENLAAFDLFYDQDKDEWEIRPA